MGHLWVGEGVRGGREYIRVGPSMHNTSHTCPNLTVLCGGKRSCSSTDPFEFRHMTALRTRRSREPACGDGVGWGGPGRVGCCRTGWWGRVG